MWPETVHLNEIQSRLINDGVPVERAMRITSEVGPIQRGSRYRIELPESVVVLYAQGDGWYRTAAE